MRQRLTEELACAVVERGGLVVYPTETLWGIGGDARRMDVVRRVLACKGIDELRPFPVLADSVERVLSVVAGDIPGLKELARRFWPGSLTLAVPVSDPQLARCSGLDGRVGLRVSSLALPCRLAKACGGFLISTSANLTGAPPPRSLAQVDPVVTRSVDGVIGAGTLAGGEPSTLLVYRDDRWVLGRAGAIPLSELEEVVEVDHANLDG